VENPKDTWDDIRKAKSFDDKGNEMFYELGKIFRSTVLDEHHFLYLLLKKFI
jgi:hypothetical protein